MAKRLDAREQRFVQEYLIDLDPKRAALAAGYAATTAASKAYQWVSNSKGKPHVFAAIAAAQQARAKKVEITAAEVLENLLRIAKGEDEYEQINGLGVEVVHFPKYPDRLKAWELIGKHLGMFTDKVEHSGEQRLTVRVEYEDPQVRPE